MDGMEARVQLELAETPGTDLLICGSCKRSFQLANILGFMKHKKFDCEDPGSLIDPNNKVLLCQACRQKFNTPWSLLKHAQNVHFLRIYLEQNYHVPSVSLVEEPKNVSLSTDNGVYSSPLVEKTNLLPTESTDFAARDAAEQVVQLIPVNGAPQKDIKTELGVVSRGFTDSSDASSNGKCKDDDKAKSDEVCCDDQDCGINVMPGTHESLKRCCSAVVPKKRKRHMEIKHRMNFLSRMRRQRNRSSSPASIIIDVTAPESEQPTCKQGFPVEEPNVGTAVGRELDNAGEHQPNKMNSVIIQPGSTFSIPLSFAKAVELSAEQKTSKMLMQGQFKVPSSSAQVASLSQGYLPHDNTPALSQPARDDTSVEVSSDARAFEKNADDSKTSPSNILQGILAQMFSEKTDVKTGLVSGSIEVASSQKAITVKPDPNASNQCVGADKPHSSTGRSLTGKKRRYPTSRPYKCDQCNDAFNQRIHLKKHQSKHTGIKPFKCDLCDYATVERSHLKVHIRVHTGEKPFKCTYCEYATAQRSTLKIHLKRHHSATDHCLHCSRQDHTQCYQTGLPPGADNNNLVRATGVVSPGGAAVVKAPGKTSPPAAGSDLDSEK